MQQYADEAIAREVNAQIPVVYLGGPDAQQFIGQGVVSSRYISKPSDPFRIVRALDEDAPLAPVGLK